MLKGKKGIDRKNKSINICNTSSSFIIINIYFFLHITMFWMSRKGNYILYIIYTCH